jgi:hypothetical protein
MRSAVGAGTKDVEPREAALALSVTRARNSNDASVSGGGSLWRGARLFYKVSWFQHCVSTTRVFNWCAPKCKNPLQPRSLSATSKDWQVRRFRLTVSVARPEVGAMKSACGRRISDLLQKRQKIVELRADAVHVPAVLVARSSSRI